MKSLKLSLALALSALPALSVADSETEKLAKAAQNPIASMISLPF